MWLSPRGFIVLFVIVFIWGSSLIAQNAEKASGELELNITGKNLPIQRSMDVEMDVKTCGKNRASKAIQISPLGELQNAVVWLEASPPRREVVFTNKEEMKITIRDCEFSPRIMVVSADQPIQLNTEDPILFQIRSGGHNNPRQTRPLPPNLEGVQFRFREPEIVPLFCDLHPWMQAFVVVAPHSHYRISARNGRVNFKKLLPGNYSIHLWHEILGSKTLPDPVNIKSKQIKMKYEWDYLDTEGPVAIGK
ncbi:MAG: hypothetical protein JWQ35_778 [Bacteriovoracaceae bacterium]|nr:hypothetical protein [Bacteriovoracaceae bacterium]